MYAGKKKCRLLKGIRQKIADANGIKYSPHKCNHKGDCQGTCPACEQEVQYLEGQLRKRSRLGKAAMVVGTAVGITALASSMTSCKYSGQVVGKVPVEQPLEGEPVDSSGLTVGDSTELDTAGAKHFVPLSKEAEEGLKQNID